MVGNEESSSVTPLEAGANQRPSLQKQLDNLKSQLGIGSFVDLRRFRLEGKEFQALHDTLIGAVKNQDLLDLTTLIEEQGGNPCVIYTDTGDDQITRKLIIRSSVRAMGDISKLPRDLTKLRGVFDLQESSPGAPDQVRTFFLDKSYTMRHAGKDAHPPFHPYKPGSRKITADEVDGNLKGYIAYASTVLATPAGPAATPIPTPTPTV